MVLVVYMQDDLSGSLIYKNMPTEASLIQYSLFKPFLYESNFCIRKASLDFSTNGSLFFTCSTARPCRLLTEWPGKVKCCPEGSSTLPDFG